MSAGCSSPAGVARFVNPKVFFWRTFYNVGIEQLKRIDEQLENLKTETDSAKNPVDAIKRSREAMNFLCDYVLDQNYDLKLALEAKPNEPRGDIYNPTTGHMLAFINTLEHPEMVGVNPEVAHEHMAGLKSWRSFRYF